MQGLRRKIALVALDAVLLSAAYILAFWLRLGWQGFRGDVAIIAQTLPILLVISLYVHLRYGLFNAILRYASVDTAVAVLKSVVMSVLLSCLVLFLVFRLDGIPRSVFVIYGMAALLLVGAARLAVRLRLNGARPNGKSRRILLYGAGDTAELVLRGLRMSRGLEYHAVALIDDDPAKYGREIHGVRIHGGLETLSGIAQAARLNELWICLPDLPGETLRKVYEAASAVRVQVKLLPRLEHALLGEDLRRFHEPDISDLLRRPPRSLDRARMRDWIRGRRVLITGAGGSIGRELARQVSQLGPDALALCDCSEENLFEIHHELTPRSSGMILRPFLTNVCDQDAVTRMFREARPDVVFHAAAYKHVPLVEMNPCEGVLTNVKGVAVVARAAIDYGVREFVFISTDKAVRPANIMGATKRLGEKVIQTLNKEGRTRFMAVRFGNVLGSSGSVVPIFQEQIRSGRPVTITHPDMTRYFMLVSEAVELVIQAGSIGGGGEIFILDMGEAVRIADMARDLIRLMGKEPERDVPIRITGPRPGEKIHEDLLLSPDDARTSFPDIWVDHEPPPPWAWGTMGPELARLFDAANRGDVGATVSRLKRLVARFVPVYEATQKLIRESELADAPGKSSDIIPPGAHPAAPAKSSDIIPPGAVPVTAAKSLPVGR